MDELEQLRRLAGVNEFKGLRPVNLENISHTAAAIRKKEKELNLKPGDQDWFKLWFTLPYLTGSVNSKFRGRKK
jgi:hypothetical protein